MSPNQLPIRTPSLLLRQFTVQDAATVLALSNEEASRTWLPSQVFRDHPHALSVLEYLIGQYSTPGNPRHGPYVLAIEHRTDGALIGHVGFSPLDDEVEIGFAIAQNYQGHGFAAEAIVAASRWVFHTFELDKIVAITAAANTASKRTLLRARFTHKEDKVMDFQGTEQDVCVYALLPEPGDE